HMKNRLLIFAAIILLSISLQAQESKEQKYNGKIGLTFSSFGENDFIRFKNVEGSASYLGESFYTIGINYIKPLNNWLEIESGIEYSKHHITVEPNLPPDMDNSPYKADFSILNIPISVRANFLKYFFVNGGLMLDLELGNSNPADNQTGIGALLGVAAKYDFNFGASVFINPYLKAHSLLPFSGEKYHQRLMEDGIRIGITFNLDKVY
ncbi:MAG: hypothetical protein ABFS12_16430, partial [Bacteroidota bacterium]